MKKEKEELEKRSSVKISGGKRKVPGRILLTVLLLGSGILFLPAIRKFVVTSPSMTPSLPVGSCVFVKQAAFDAIHEGSIITYRLADSGIPVTHRVISVDDGGRSFRTKGDANHAPDAAAVPYDHVIGTVWCSVPYLGYFLFFWQSAAGKGIAVSGCVLVVFAELYVRFGGRRKVR